MQYQQINSCRVCGYTNEDFTPWGDDGKYPLFEICPCCGIESGYEDISPESIASNRKKWMESAKYNSNIKYHKQLENLLK
ncbi:hypothetical protein [Psychrobacter sp. FDAARGOS_221]|uniref:hypothetical protein n=1 Tax=Psychrobacter sp. FDAARGOS_221 TaxID=1975705 RepID=UPI000BB55732|nr:hypothetical protein [Psychrobacter sp. FDAARGOS_221]PNK61163.1 hypothetical protein A6J60_009975 [Psychrobacter sp. FDAARGOS_221]